MRAFVVTRPAIRALFAFAAVVAIVLVVFEPGAERAFAADPVTRTWTGAGANANWMTNANWNPGVPVAGDILVFPAAAARKSNINNFPAGTSFTRIELRGGGYTLNGARVTLTNQLVGDAPGGVNTMAIGIDGAGGVHNSDGDLYLVGTNTFTGASFVDGGEVFAGSNAPFGAPSAIVDILAGGITLGPGVTIANKLIIGGPSEPVLSGTGNATWTGPVSLIATATFDAVAGATVSMTGQVSGAGRFTKTGPGRVVLAGANSYTGLTNVNEGVLRVTNASSLGGDALGTFVEDGAALEVQAVNLGSENVTIAGHGTNFAGALIVTAGPAVLNTLIIDGESSLSVLEGELLLPEGIFHGGDAGDLFKLGPGKVVIDGPGEFTETLVIELGEVALLSTIDGDVMLVGGKLTGDGTLQNLTAVSGLVEPGVAGDGFLTVLGNAALGGTSQFRVSIQDDLAHSFLRVHGDITLAGASLGFTGVGAIPVGEGFTLIENFGPGDVTGTFDDLPEGSTVNYGGKVFELTYDGDGTGSVVLSRSAADFEATDLGVAMPSLPATAFEDAEVTVTYHGFNFGPAPAAEATIRIAVRDGVRVKDVEAPDEWSCVPPPGGINGPIECTRSDWAPTGPNNPAVFTVVFTVIGAVGDGILFDAFAVYAGDDPNVDNNTAHRFVDIIGPDLMPFKLRLPFVARDGAN